MGDADFAAWTNEALQSIAELAPEAYARVEILYARLSQSIRARPSTYGRRSIGSVR